jgi:outer membrane protein assembly factor BamB
MYAMAPNHNAHYPSTFPAVSWHYEVPGAPQANASKLLTRTMIRDLVGFPIGAAVVDDTVYAPNDDGYLYALNAHTGKLLWRFNAFNQLMTTPIVATVAGRKLVFVGAGNSVFAYSHAVKFAEPSARVVRGTGLSAIYAVDAVTGKQVWVYRTQGEDMPTAVFYKGKLLFGNGDGHVYALDAGTGKRLWKTDIRSFVSMSSATLDLARGVLVMGGTHPSRIYGIDATSGKVLWSVVPPGVFSSSAGDGTWAIEGDRAIGQIETRHGDQARTGKSSSEELAIDLASGRILWSTTLGSGRTPPRNKDAVPAVVDGIVYTGSPVTHTEYALNANRGNILWQRHLDASMKAAPVAVGSFIIQPMTSGNLVTIDRRNGKIRHVLNLHQGGYGPQNPVVIGHTLFIGTNAGTFEAIPLQRLGVRQ